ncbi:MAG TPA: ATP-binding protein [Ramlibacter sp.]|nr:ATP-binding protein [Ramlibacter sp.]
MPAARGTPTINSRLVGLMVLFVGPVLLSAIAAVYFIYREEDERFQQGVREATRALAIVVDRELAKREAVLRTLSNSPTITKGDLESFHGYAREVAPADDAVIVLSDLAGQQLLNTRRPFGDPALPKTVFAEARARGATGTLVSDVYFAPFGKQWSFAVEVPVERGGKVIHYLAMGSFASHLQKVVDDQKLPRGWIGSVIDRQGNIVARSINPEGLVGRRVTEDMLERLARGNEGAFRTVSVDGTPVLAAFSRMPSSGWGFVIGVPVRQITHPLHAAGLAAAAGLALLVALLVAASRVARRIGAPVQAIYTASQSLGQDADLPTGSTGLLETDRVLQALADSHRSLRDSKELMEAKVQEALADAQRAQRAIVQNQRLEAIGHLTGGVAHDFNNLLMVVGNNAHLLRLRHPELKNSNALAGIQRAVETGSKLTRQLLSFAHRQAVKPEVVRLQQHLPELVDLIRPALRSDIGLRCTVDEDTAAVLLDPAEFEVAMINLAVNAKDAMPAGGELCFSARNTADQPPRVVIEVSDTGRGIEPDLLGRVFEPFFTTKPVGHGTGLGLSQVYGFATQAGGTVQIESEPGRGTKVRLVLPRTLEAAAAVPAKPGRAAARILDLHVVLVEDNADLAQVTRTLLVGCGATVTDFRSGDAAQEAFEAGLECDCVLSDIKMPGRTNGIALAEWLQRRRPGLPVVLMTGYSQELDQAAGLDLAVLRKPCPPQLLIATLAQHVGVAGTAPEQA